MVKLAKGVVRAVLGSLSIGLGMAVMALSAMAASTVAAPTFSPPGGTYTSTQTVTLASATPGATIRYTTNGADPTSSSTAYNGPISVPATTTLKARAFKASMTNSAVASAAYTISLPAEQKVVLLLHGMNSDPYTWDEYIAKHCNGRAPIIYGGAFTQSNPLNFTPTDGILCYRVEFGARDVASGRSNLETWKSDAKPTGPKSGDFTTFADLGREVKDAVVKIQAEHSNRAKITLIGHSRGGLAARAFLQAPESNAAKQSVVALLTTGTPHKGSRLGRIHEYLTSNCIANGARKGCKDDWQVVDLLNGTYTGALCVNPDPLDIGRPTINDLADTSAATTYPILDLNSAVANLPLTVKYGALVYSGTDLGKLTKSYAVFGGVCDSTTTTLKTKVLDGGKPSDYSGDGIVHADSQKFNTITGFPAKASVEVKNGASGILHTGQPKQTDDIRSTLKSIMSW